MVGTVRLLPFLVRVFIDQWEAGSPVDNRIQPRGINKLVTKGLFRNEPSATSWRQRFAVQWPPNTVVVTAYQGSLLQRVGPGEVLSPATRGAFLARQVPAGEHGDGPTPHR